MTILDEISDAVTRTKVVLLAQLQVARPEIASINFQPGTISEISKTLDAWSKDDNLRYQKLPGIFPLTPYDVSYPRGQELQQWKGTIIIAVATTPTMIRMEREADTFAPILRPIAEEFIRQICASNLFWTYGFSDISYRFIEHDYWAKDKKANQFNEFVDAIEIRDLTINLSPNQNCS